MCAPWQPTQKQLLKQSQYGGLSQHATVSWHLRREIFFCSLTTQYLSIYFHLLPVPLSLLQFCVNYLKPEKWHAVWISSIQHVDGKMFSVFYFLFFISSWYSDLQCIFSVFYRTPTYPPFRLGCVTHGF